MTMSIPIGSLIRYTNVDDPQLTFFGIVTDNHDKYNNSDSRASVSVLWSDDGTTTREIVDRVLEGVFLELISEGP